MARSPFKRRTTSARAPKRRRRASAAAPAPRRRRSPAPPRRSGRRRVRRSVRGLGGMLGGLVPFTMPEAGAAVVGAILTRQVSDRVLGTGNTGAPGYMMNAAVALGGAFAASKIARFRALAKPLALGGVAFIGARYMGTEYFKQNFPFLSGYVDLGSDYGYVGVGPDGSVMEANALQLGGDFSDTDPDDDGAGFAGGLAGEIPPYMALPPTL